MTTRTTTILIVIAAIAILGAAIYNLSHPVKPIIVIHDKGSKLVVDTLHSEINKETLKR